MKFERLVRAIAIHKHSDKQQVDESKFIKKKLEVDGKPVGNASPGPRIYARTHKRADNTKTSCLRPHLLDDERRHKMA